MTRFEPFRSFEYSVNDFHSPAARWRFELEPQARGTRLTMWAQMGPGRSGVSYFIHKNPEQEDEIVATRLDQWRTKMPATVARIRTIAESR